VRQGLPGTIQYWLKQPAQNLRLDILDAKGQVIRTYPDTTNAGGRGGRGRGGAADSAEAGGGGGGGGRGRGGPPPGPARAVGLNTFTWDGAYAPAATFPGMILWGGSTQGPQAAPGRYQVRLTVDGTTLTQPLVVRRNPMRDASDADLVAQQTLALQLRDKVSEANAAVLQIRNVKGQITDRLGKSNDEKLKTTGDRFSNNLGDVEDDIYQVKNQSGQDPLNYPIKVNNRLASLLGVVSRSEGRPNAQLYSIFNDLKAELKVETDRYQKVLATDLPAFNAELKRLGLEAIVVNRPVVF
jgi:hypothetical protein